ncbi:CsiV family protein [Pseudidiomarina sp. E22-M8]|uniref:CsiV family protein n=1 Tax=Pseudidiomarina sp. E22-M8 TaxID=3424768 RepID=UPI00403C4209
MVANSLWHQFTQLSKPVLMLAAVFGCHAVMAQVQSERNTWRWFEVEVLVFAHTNNEPEAESFSWQGPSAPENVHYDFLTHYFAPDIHPAIVTLPECKVPAIVPTFDRDSVLCARPLELSQWLPMNWHRPERAIALLDRAPEQVVDGPGGDVNKATNVFLAPEKQLELSAMRQQIVRRGVGKPLMHLSWYQPVFERQQNYKVRLFGGVNYGKTYAPSGYPYAPEEDEFIAFEAKANAVKEEALSDRLAQLMQLQQQAGLHFTARAEDQPLAPPPLIQRPQQPEAVWQLDGTMHIYLVGNYLHIASDLELREPQQVLWQPASLSAQADQALQGDSSGSFLRSFNLEQLRRVISHETHYFDHPKLGLIVQIRRTDLSAPRY